MTDRVTQVTAAEVYAATGSYHVPQILGWDGRPVTYNDLHSPIDMGPGDPLPPRIPVAGYPPREHQYPLGFNLIPTPRTEGGKAYSFAQLRAWADTCSYFRLAVEYRKKQVRARRFEVVPVEDSKSSAARRKHQGEIDRVKGFLEKPNRVDGLGFSTWIGQAIEEALTVDALCFFKQWHFNGSLSYVQVDGQTIKPVLDQWGHVVGYQQILYGMPTTRYSAPVIDDYGKGELAYWVYNPRVTGVYGTSAIEEILPIILTAIKRTQAHLGWYTDGNIPDAFLSSPEGWTADQIIKFQKFLDEELTDPRQRRKARVLPHGSTYVQAKPFSFSKEEEDAIAAIVLAYMGVPKHVLVSQVNRATAETQQEDAGDVGLTPLVRWLEENLTTVIQEDLGAAELKVICTDGLQGQDDAETDNDVKLIAAKVLTADEVRAKRGLEPMAQEKTVAGRIDPQYLTRAIFEAGIVTRNEIRRSVGLGDAPEGGDQYVTVGAFSATPPEQIEAAPAGAKPAFGAPPQMGAPDATRDAVVAHAVGLLTEPDEPAAKAERAAWRRWALNRFAKGKHTEPFRCDHIGEHDAAPIRKALASARTREDVLAAFEKKAKALTEAKKESAVATVKSAAMKLFEKQYGEAMAKAREVLGA
jgi:hypothetical protein